MWSAIFPGQGSQSVGMGQYQYDNFKSSRELFEEASDTLSIDFKKLCFSDPDKQLGLTENTQPAILLVSICCDKILKQDIEISFKTTAGHSIGEYAAIVSTGGMSFVDALKAVRIRGQAMQAAVPVGQGGMTAVMGLDERQIEILCSWGNERAQEALGLDNNIKVEPANFNCPGQVVISGAKQILDWLQANASIEAIFTDAKLTPPKRLKLIPLAVSAPFHCSMMKPAEEKMKSVLNDISFNDIEVPVVQNVNAELVNLANDLRKNLIAQVTAPVLWTQSFSKLSDFFNIEVGHGKVLQGLGKKINKEVKTLGFNNSEDLKAIEQLQATL